MKATFSWILLTGLLMHFPETGASQCTISNNTITPPNTTWYCGNSFNFNSIGGSTPLIAGSGCNLGGYQWQSKPLVGQWQNINGATLRNYDPELQFTTKSYRRVVRASDNTTNISGEVMLEVYPTAPVDVTIQSDPPGQVCTGDSVTYSASVSNGGNAPLYKWFVNGSAVGTNLSYSYVPVNLDQVKCRVTSNSHCISGSPTDSNSVTTIVSAGNILPRLLIYNDPGTTFICQGTLVTFNADLTNPGKHPVFQWKSNGVNIPGETNKTYVTTQLTNNEAITCNGTSDLRCAYPKTVPSENSITMTVEPRADAGALVQNGANGCLNEPDTLFLTGYQGTVSEWQQNASDTAWKVYYKGWVDYYLPLDNKEPGTFRYRAIVKSLTLCPPDTSNEVAITVTRSNRQTLVEKAPEVHSARGDLFLICTTCGNARDTLNFTYEWGYTAQDTDVYMPGFRNKAFCLYPTRDLQSKKYFLDVTYQSAKTACDRTYATDLLAGAGDRVASILTYPNPNPGIFTLAVSSAFTGNCRLSVRNMLGRPVRTAHLVKSAPDQNFEMNFGMMERGVYLIEVVCENGDRLIARILVQ